MVLVRYETPNNKSIPPFVLPENVELLTQSVPPALLTRIPPPSLAELAENVELMIVTVPPPTPIPPPP
jgi:hypothetical protein